MKKKIAILGSTGSIGKTLLEIIKKDKKNFEIMLLTANKRHISLLSQAKKYNVKNLIIINKKSYEILNKKTKNLNIKIYNDFNCLDKIFKKKVDYIMSSITGIDGLIPTINSIKFTKKIAIANKESIICAWNLIQSEIKKNKTKFIPVDSEHFSIWYALRNNFSNIEKIFLTASGGPFNSLPLKNFKKINIKQALKHPNWKMGKKISVDSATMMNKVFEIIEAKNIFDIDYKKLTILIHPKSYIHAIIKFNNGMIKIIAHDTNMKVPIFNSLYLNSDKGIKTDKLNLVNLNNLEFKFVNTKRFPIVSVLKNISNKSSLFETLIVSANDEFVGLFLDNKIQFVDIYKKLIKFIKLKEFKKLKSIRVKKIDDIIKLNNYVRLKIRSKFYNQI